MAWYGARAESLDLDFFRRFEAAVTAAAERPEAYQQVYGEVRRIVLQRFPYVMFYRFDGREVLVLSCQHERRSPDRWPRG